MNVGSKYAAVNTVLEGVQRLDNEPELMFAFISLDPQDTTLQAFINNIKDQNLTTHFRSLFNEITKQTYHEMFPEEASIFTFEESDYFGDYRLRPNAYLHFKTAAGGTTSFAVPNDKFVHEVAVQCNNGRSINREKHKDQNSAITVNLYGEGDGLRYIMNDNIITLKSPVITMHRGVKHRFGEQSAILHQGVDQKGDRANLAFELDTVPPLESHNM